MLGDNIRYLRKRSGYSQEQLAKKLNIKQASVSNWESGKSKPETKYLFQLAKIFDIPLDMLANDSPQRDLDGVVAMRKMAVPVVGDIACGEQITAQENIDGYVDLPEGVHADFALRCKGDSMMPIFKEGDFVLIRQQPEVETGQIAAIGINGEATLKHVYKTETGLLLCAENPLYAPIQTKPEDEIVIYGLAIGYTRIFL